MRSAHRPSLLMRCSSLRLRQRTGVGSEQLRRRGRDRRRCRSNVDAAVRSLRTPARHSSCADSVATRSFGSSRHRCRCRCRTSSDCKACRCGLPLMYCSTVANALLRGYAAARKTRPTRCFRALHHRALRTPHSTLCSLPHNAVLRAL